MVSSDSEGFNKKNIKPLDVNDIKVLSDFIQEKYTQQERSKLKSPKYFYEVAFDKPGGMLMPILVQLVYEDGTTEDFNFPVQIWRKGNQVVSRVFATDKKVAKIKLDPKLQTADIDLENNSWPREKAKSKFDELED